LVDSTCNYLLIMKSVELCSQQNAEIKQETKNAHGNRKEIQTNRKTDALYTRDNLSRGNTNTTK